MGGGGSGGWGGGEGRVATEAIATAARYLPSNPPPRPSLNVHDGDVASVLAGSQLTADSSVSSGTRWVLVLVGALMKQLE